MNRISKQDVKKMIANGKTFTGYITGNLIDNVPTNDELILGYKVKLTNLTDYEEYVTAFESVFLQRIEGFGNRAVFFRG
ncbi:MULTISPECIES: hypothetical protein [Heyndrickxia]|uniref:hypothetical protein n=1 Tax=Heyndrickxia TaxID=2837504 RepID=UPI002DB8BA65|nr:hypothetical protein [Weizmannia sp. CD-2023]MEC2225021.1 hypothetical protein [Weizmannia sp. CD-2023]